MLPGTASCSRAFAAEDAEKTAENDGEELSIAGPGGKRPVGNAGCSQGEPKSLRQLRHGKNLVSATARQRHFDLLKAFLCVRSLCPPRFIASYLIAAAISARMRAMVAA